MIRKVQTEDAEAIAAIYNHYIAQTTITFETEPVSTEEMKRRILSISRNYPYWIRRWQTRPRAASTQGPRS